MALAFVKSVRLTSSLLIALIGTVCSGTAFAQDKTPQGNQSGQYVARNTGEVATKPSKPEDPSTSANSATPSTSAAPAAASDIPSGPAYRIGIDDELQISVWREPELSGPVVVRPDGMITLPLVDDLNVVGQTTKQLQALLTEKLKPFVNEPQVTVIVRSIRSRKVYLMGQVPRPGAYPISDRTTVMQLLAQAGGLNPFAKTSSIYVLRHQNGREIRIPFNYKHALKGVPEREEVILTPGDMIVVP